MAKKEPKKVKPKAKGQEKSSSRSELSEDQLEQVAGGATGDYFLKLDGIKGESTVTQKEFIYQSSNPLPVKLFKI